MTKNIVFMTETELSEAVERITGVSEARPGFNEEWETDTVHIPQGESKGNLPAFLTTLSSEERIGRDTDEQEVELPVSSFIPEISKMLKLPLQDKVDVCECNLFEGEVLYAFFVAA